MLDHLSGLMILIVTGVGFLIHVYSLGYMHEDPDVARYFAYLNLFTGSMLILVLADYTVQAWADLTIPELGVTVRAAPSAEPVPGERVLLITSRLPGY